MTLNPYPTPFGMLTYMTSLTFHMLLLLCYGRRSGPHREDLAGGRLSRSFLDDMPTAKLVSEVAPRRVVEAPALAPTMRESSGMAPVHSAAGPTERRGWFRRWMRAAG